MRQRHFHRTILTLLALGAGLLSAAAAGCSGGGADAPGGQGAVGGRGAGSGSASAGVLATFIELGSDKCIPCIQMRPVMAEIQSTYADQVRVVFHDVWTDEGAPYARQYGIRVIPTQVFLDAEGREYYRHEGYFPTAEVVKILALQGVKTQ